MIALSLKFSDVLEENGLEKRGGGRAKAEIRDSGGREYFRCQTFACIRYVI